MLFIWSTSIRKRNTLKDCFGASKFFHHVSFNFIDGKVAYRRGDIGFFTSPYYKRVWSRLLAKLNSGSLSQGDEYLKENCVYSIIAPNTKTKKRGPNLEGKITKDGMKAVLFCLTHVEAVTSFINEVFKFYSDYIIKLTNPVDMQKFTPDDPRKLMYYTTDVGKFFNGITMEKFPIGWGIVNDYGVIFTEINVKISLIRLITWILISFLGTSINKRGACHY